MDLTTPPRTPESAAAASPSLPPARGPLTEALFARLTDGRPLREPVGLDSVDPLVDDDLQLALWCCYELHHHGFDAVGDHLEWDRQVLGFRASLEAAFEAALRSEVETTSLPRDPRVAVRLIAEWAGPSLSRWMEEHGTLDHLREFAIHRSAYQLKEADGHSWGIPRLRGPGRSAYISIQVDEYGQGVAGQAHYELFAAGLADLGLVTDFGRYVDRLPGVTLATDNLLSLFGLHRRNRGCLVGHLAYFELTSVTPMSRYLAVARRLGSLPNLERFYAVHVEADVHHGHLAGEHMVGAFVDSEPELADAIAFGAAALSRVENRFARHLLRSWEQNRSSLRPDPTAEPATDPPATDPPATDPPGGTPQLAAV